MTPATARQAFEAASMAWAEMESTAAEREADYQLLRGRVGADPAAVEQARIVWGVAHTSAAVLWFERAGAQDRLSRVEHLVGVG